MVFSPWDFLEGQGGTDVANKEREEQGRTNVATKEGQRGRKNKNKKRGWTCHVTKTCEIPNWVLQDWCDYMRLPKWVLQAGTKPKTGTPGKDQFQNWYSREGPECDHDLVTETKVWHVWHFTPKKGNFILQTSALKIVLEYTHSLEQHSVRSSSWVHHMDYFTYWYFLTCTISESVCH